MISVSRDEWEIAGGLATVAVLGGAILWLVLRKRPTQDEIEQQRRRQLVQSGRLVDGMLLDLCEMKGEDGRTLNLLLFSYRIGGVDYECSQDITAMHDVIAPEEVRVGYPCTVRYQPGNPQNSIVIAEGWSGIRDSLHHVHGHEGPKAAGSPHTPTPSL